MLKRIGAIFVVIYCCSASAVFSQTIKTFTSDSVIFLEEMTTFLETSRKKEGKEFIEEFTPVWYGGNFSKQERRGIYNTCNFMLKKRMRPFPDFKNYLYSLMSFVKSDQSLESFEAWQESLEKLIDSRNKKNFISYLKFCEDLFTDNSIYKSASTTWQASNANYKFEFDDKPKLVFPSLDLRCFAKGDSSVIYKTGGVYYPTLQKWIGKEGVVNWLRAGIEENKTYAMLSNYQIKVKSSDYTADSVMFYNTNYFDNPLMGKLTEKVLANVTPERASYPRFESYSKRLKITNLQPNIDYDGGFSQFGAKFIGSGSKEENAYLVIRREDQPFLAAASKSFVIREDRITSNRCAITIYLENDSISHPGLQLRFLNKERMLTLVRDDQGVSKSPYFNSFHDIDMHFEALYWKIDDPIIEMKPLAGSTDFSAQFESSAYYKEYIFDKLQGIDEIHPLYKLRDCARSTGLDELYVSEVAQCMRVSSSQVKSLLMHLANLGFLYYDYDNDRIKIKDKLYHYIFAKSEKEDYDVITFESNIENKSNASLNLLNFDLTIRGVRKIFLSDSHNVFIYPAGREIVLRKNRDFTFSGIVNAGRFEFFGKEFDFEYDNFKINMPNVDSLRISVLEEVADEFGSRKQIRVKSIVEYIKGELMIDHPGNKSGIKHMPEYPVFNSLKDSYVFYEKQSVQQGVYSRDNFYFHLDPFTFDSLDNFRNEALKFDGTFKSAGIFPEFTETLSLQDDYSLGFIRPAPESGFPVYGNKAQYFSKIKMSNRGLRGDGTLKYLTSISESDDFLFFPDSMNAIAQNFIIEEQMGKVQFPPVSGHDLAIHWEPYKDFMTIRKIEKPFIFYDGKSKLHGMITLRPKGLTGSGLFEFEGAELESDLFDFKFIEFFADTADFRLAALQEAEGLAFATTNVKAHIDFKNRKGNFISNGGGSFIDFPVNQYIAYMDKFTWYMENDDIELSASTKVTTGGVQDVKLEGSKFISIHPDQDSLTFYSPAARYDLKRNIIYANSVKFLNIADAMIYPDSGQLVVEKKAKMRTLKNAKIVANYITQYHNIFNSSINITARKKYTGSGYYDYIDENKRPQTIYLSDIAVDSTAQTYATGTIPEEDNFTLSPNFQYKGDVRLTANNKFMKFTGVTLIQHTCSDIPRNWFKFSSEIDPEEIYIPVDSFPVDAEDQKISAGLMLGVDSVMIYPTFLSKVNSTKDISILPTRGLLYYDKQAGEYQISNYEKLNERSLPGNYLSINTEDCKIYGEGKIDFGAKFGQVKLQTVGNVTHNTVTGEAMIDAMILFDFFFVDNALENAAKVINEYGGLDAVDFDRPVYEKGLQDLIDRESAEKLISSIALYGSFKKFPDELNKALFINNVKMKWDPATQSYLSVGPIGIGNFLKKQVNKMIDGHVQILKRSRTGGDELNIYLELDDENWYYFNFRNNIMQAFSSNKDFNEIVKDVKADDRKVKGAKGEAPYSFMLSSLARKNSFLKRLEEYQQQEQEEQKDPEKE